MARPQQAAVDLHGDRFASLQVDLPGRDPETDLEINCRGQLTLLEACRHHNPDAKVVYAGTRQVYGKPVRLPVDDTWRTRRY